MIRRILFLSFLALVGASSVGADVLSIDAAVDYGLKNSKQVEALKSYAEAMGFEIKDDAKLANPKVDGQILYDDGDEMDSEYGIQINAMDLLLKPIRNKGRNSQLATNQNVLIMKSMEYVRQVRQSYYDVLIDQEILKEWSVHQDFLIEKQDIIDRQFAEGHISRLALQRYDLNFRKVQMSRSQAQLAFDLSKKQLAFLMGDQNALEGKAFDNALLSVSHQDEGLENYIQKAYENRQDLQSLKNEIKSVENESTLANFKAWADLDLGAVTEKSEGSDRLLGPTFEWAIPIFNWGGSARHKNKWMLKQKQSELAFKQQEIDFEIQQAYASLTHQRFKTNQYETNILVHQDELLALSLESYQVMQQDLNDFLQDRRFAMETRVNYYETVRSYWKEYVDLDYLSGVILDDFMLKSR